MSLHLKDGFNVLFERLPTSEKILHILVMLWVLLQIITSNFMHVHSDTLWTEINVVSHIHAYGGLLLIPITLLFSWKIIKRRKMSDIYPWLYKDISEIKKDIKTLSTFRLPEVRPGGLAATIEGLGLLALLLALVTGAMWYISASNGNLSFSPQLLEIHKTSVGFIEAYFYGHGLFGLLHLADWWRSQRT
ncbi:cytochrome b/b6 domain-containing protein [Aliivibrio sp. SR45-2]|uniref:cytochrome b/b6 domain-containing protein n=1 Tax=Aliivibrio sp. SR45-2 TaxID=2760931 RepID=UPI0015FABB13|nr:cytochrome b/b6 domain-containing protein [Aliivibrio sp. SR45-2]MBB1312929.1 cytochrome b/b6 domain-containing protein [Aliivibrio sp. SR45-2]